MARTRPSPASASPAARTAAKVTGWATRGDPSNVVMTLGRHRGLFRAWLPFASWLLFRTGLPREDVELLVLRTAWNCASPYEWSHHVALAERSGLDHDLIVQVGELPADGGWSARQRLLLRAADELHEQQVVSDPTRRELRGHLTDNELIEMCFVVGHYEMLAMTLNTMRVDAEPSAEKRLGPRARGLADQLVQQLADRSREPALGPARDAPHQSH